MAAEAGVTEPEHSFPAWFWDYDNDGWLDMYLGTGEPDYKGLMPNRMFRQDGAGKFLAVTTAGGFGSLQKGHGIAFGDLDADGDQDIYAVMGGAFTGDVYQNILFENPGNWGHHWITLRLEGRQANRSAIGARLQLDLGGPEGPHSIHHLVGTGGSFGSQSLQAELGLGKAERITRLPAGVYWRP